MMFNHFGLLFFTEEAEVVSKGVIVRVFPGDPGFLSEASSRASRLLTVAHRVAKSSGVGTEGGAWFLVALE